jgi:hypothetical protein
MIYLIGGPVRVGKSTLAKLVLERNHIASITTDALTNCIGRNLPATRLAGSHIPQEEWEENAYPFIRRFIKTIQYDYPDYLLEGAALSPVVVQRLSQKFPVRAVFVGNSTTNADILAEHMGNNLWIKSASPEELQHIPTAIITRSHFLERECQKLGYYYVDLANNFEQKIEEAYQALFSSKDSTDR